MMTTHPDGGSGAIVLVCLVALFLAIRWQRYLVGRFRREDPRADENDDREERIEVIRRGVERRRLYLAPDVHEERRR